MNETLARLDSELATALAGLDAAQTQLTPAKTVDKWNIQQIVEHLRMSFRTTVGVLQTRIEKGSPTLAKPSFQQRIGQVTLIGLGSFPRGRKSPPAVEPSQDASPETGQELSADVHRDLTALDASADQAQALFGAIRCASHLVLGPLSVPQWRKFHLVHGEHHIAQIRTIRREHQV